MYTHSIKKLNDQAGSVITVDFDGTVALHEFPKIGEDVPFAVEVLKRLNAAGVRLVCWTMRSGEYLADAKQWFDDRGIEIWSFNCNPEQVDWSDSPKCYAHAYIDDAALGTPLLYRKGSRPFVNWKEMEKALEKRGYLPAVGRCEYCLKGDGPRFLDQDGVLCSISKDIGQLSHAQEDYSWPCPNSCFCSSEALTPCCALGSATCDYVQGFCRHCGERKAPSSDEINRKFERFMFGGAMQENE